MIHRRVSPPSTADPELVAELRAGVLGHVLVSGDPGYDETRIAWNGMYDHRRPGGDRPAQGVADVQAAIAFARANDLAARGARRRPQRLRREHDRGAGCCSTSRLMRGVRVDPERQVAFAGAGTVFRSSTARRRCTASRPPAG